MINSETAAGFRERYSRRTAVTRGIIIGGIIGVIEILTAHYTGLKGAGLLGSSMGATVSEILEFRSWITKVRRFENQH